MSSYNPLHSKLETVCDECTANLLSSHDRLCSLLPVLRAQPATAHMAPLVQTISNYSSLDISKSVFQCPRDHTGKSREEFDYFMEQLEQLKALATTTCSAGVPVDWLEIASGMVLTIMVQIEHAMKGLKRAEEELYRMSRPQMVPQDGGRGGRLDLGPVTYAGYSQHQEESAATTPSRGDEGYRSGSSAVTGYGEEEEPYRMNRPQMVPQDGDRGGRLDLGPVEGINSAGVGPVTYAGYSQHQEESAATTPSRGDEGCRSGSSAVTGYGEEEGGRWASQSFTGSGFGEYKNS